MSLPGFSSPAAGPEAPLDMLAACHTRVEKQCRTLERLQAHLSTHGSDTAAQEAAHAVLRYFNSAAKHHHEDEEDNLFPALLEAMAGSDAVCIRELTEALEADHRQLEQRWAALRVKLQAIAQGQAQVLSEEEVEAFTDGYRAHILREDTELLPMAQRLLDDQALREIGQAMRQRRGL
ncbi:MAG: hemerythrin domain-containing protein [Limnohabitans sp.]|nr:MAG: hemerythrin domain-containing protein [Limnohabitans sp.]